MTLNEIATAMLEAATLFQRHLRHAAGWPADCCSAELTRARQIAAKCAKALPTAGLTATCSACERRQRAWFATGIAHSGRPHALCSRACVKWWRDRDLGVVVVGHGREWADELPGRRAA